MGVITISRQLGSLGQEVAAITAQRLGYTLAWRDIINAAARRAGAPEAALSMMDELGLLGDCATPKMRREYRRAVEQVMTELAAAGRAVIIGRAGQVILRDYTAVLHVQIVAPASLRAERLAQEQHIPLAAAQAQVQASDRFRRDYLRRWYRVRWDDPNLYDLVINTAHWTPAAAADLIVTALTLKTASPESPGKGADSQP